MIIDFAPDDLRPLVQLVVAEAMAKVEAERAKLDGRLAYTEPEAAALLGIPRHSLRDCRLRGEVTASRIGKRIVYSREALSEFLTARELEK